LHYPHTWVIIKLMDNAFPRSLSLPHGDLTFPVYLPDATYGMVRAVDAADLLACGVEALVMNTFHLMQRPGSSTIAALGGLHRMSGWPRPIFTDSGGFQAYSLIRQNPKFGSLGPQGLTFQPEGAERKFQLTPEKSVQLQVGYGSDVVICLDDCTDVDAARSEQEKSVRRTVAWAKRGKEEYERLLKSKKLEAAARPRLFAVIQGGGELDLRRHCADALLEIGFDGFGFGGWPLDAEGGLLADILAYTRQLVPPQFPMHALGVGHPKNVLVCWDLGYGIFDSALPTRDARHARLYAFTQPASEAECGLSGDWMDFVYINDERHIKADLPVSEGCACLTCSRYSRGYLHHLFKMNDNLYFRLATIHNLRFMVELTERLRQRSMMTRES
jgi:queuine tRNA-ribosyltransferase